MYITCITKNFTGYIPTASVCDLNTSNQYVMDTAGSHTSPVFLILYRGLVKWSKLLWLEIHNDLALTTHLRFFGLPLAHCPMNMQASTMVIRRWQAWNKMDQTLEKTTLAPRFCNSAMIRGELEPAKSKSWSLIQLLKRGWLSVLQCSTHAQVAWVQTFLPDERVGSRLQCHLGSATAPGPTGWICKSVSMTCIANWLLLGVSSLWWALIHDGHMLIQGQQNRA